MHLPYLEQLFLICLTYLGNISLHLPHLEQLFLSCLIYLGNSSVNLPHLKQLFLSCLIYLDNSSVHLPHLEQLFLSCLIYLGNSTVHLPHLEQLCGESARLTHHLAAAVLCTPSRAAFLTGRYARRWAIFYTFFGNQKGRNQFLCPHYHGLYSYPGTMFK